jgi:hypothetical protein
MRSGRENVLSELHTQTSAGRTQTAAGERLLSDGLRRAWQNIRAKITALLQGGIDRLLFALDRGAAPDTDGSRMHQQNAADALRAQFGGFPAEALLNASPGEREEIAARMHVAVARALGIEECVVIARPLGGDCGTYSFRTQILSLDSFELEKQPMTRLEAMEIVDTILHETYHALQHRAIVHPSRYGVLKSDAAVWRINFEHYVTPKENHMRYLVQPVEVSARCFAAQVLRQFYG